MDEHRLADANKLTVIPFDPPFSSFQYVDDHYGEGNPAIRRLFSLARSQKAHTCMIEEISPAGIISDENDEIKQYVADHVMNGLERISFWKSSFDAPSANVLIEKDCIGYAIVKRDTSTSKNYDKWHVFEAVFTKYPHEHNCVPCPMQCKVALGGQVIRIYGLIYAQQNELNKRCAQVALRSLISRIKKDDVSYRQINDLARQVPTNGFDPANGLTTQQIRAVLKGFGIKYRDRDYTQGNPATQKINRESYPYQKYVYSGIESGVGALVGFRFAGPTIQDERRHIIPFYGHTFNKDTWAPDADISYFRVGENLGYIPSANWTSSFLGHDDNFGPNFCIPRLYIPPEQVEYVVELLKPGIRFGGSQAEVLSLQFLYSVLNWLPAHLKNATVLQNIWLKRLTINAHPDIQQIVLRPVAVDRETYIRHLSKERDWNQNLEDRQVIGVLRKFLPGALWIVEISIPQLFPANERKLGEIVLNGEISLSTRQSKQSNFLFARVPGLYFFEFPIGGKSTNFLYVPSNIVSHFPVIKLD